MRVFTIICSIIINFTTKISYRLSKQITITDKIMYQNDYGEFILVDQAHEPFPKHVSDCWQVLVDRN